MVTEKEKRIWIFVSHSSADLEAVRQIRNYLEEKKASPLLFHLLALKHADEFWPIIEREIMEREFFLLCESAAAEESEWVARERAAVQRASTHRAKRIGSIRVDGDDLDFAQLDRFIGTMRVFPSYAHSNSEQVLPFLEALEARGFEVFYDKGDIRPADSWAEQANKAVSAAAAHGFVLIFLTSDTLRSKWMRYEVAQAMSLNARLVPVICEHGLDLSTIPTSLWSFQHFDATLEAEPAPQRLADFLHAQAI